MKGKSNAEIARRLGVTENTAKVHVRGIAKKYGVSTRSQVVMSAFPELDAINADQYKAMAGGLPKTWAEEYMDVAVRSDPHKVIQGRIMLRLKLRGDTYYVVGQINGRRIRKTTKTSDKSIANEIRVQMEHEMLTGRRSTTTQKTFNQAVESYLKRREHTSNTTNRYLVSFMDEWGHMPVGDINQMFLEDWMDDRLSEVSGPTVRREVNVFMPVLRHANKRGWIDDVPIIERPADGEPRLRVLDEAEYQALMGGCTTITAEAAGLTKFLIAHRCADWRGHQDDVGRHFSWR